LGGIGAGWLGTMSYNSGGQQLQPRPRSAPARLAQTRRGLGSRGAARGQRTSLPLTSASLPTSLTASSGAARMLRPTTRFLGKDDGANADAAPARARRVRTRSIVTHCVHRSCRGHTIALDPLRFSRQGEHGPDVDRERRNMIVADDGTPPCFQLGATKSVACARDAAGSKPEQRAYCSEARRIGRPL